ncbi:MAG: sigma 54-interacting transcriptional regulator [Planctomycetota bacterium]
MSRSATYLRLAETNLAAGDLGAAARCLAPARDDPEARARVQELARRIARAAEAAGDAAALAEARRLLAGAGGGEAAVAPGEPAAAGGATALPAGASASGTLEAVRQLLISPELVEQLRAVVGQGAATAASASAPLALPVSEVLAELLVGGLDVERTAAVGLDLVARASGAVRAHVVLADPAQTTFGLADGPARPPETSRGVLEEVARTRRTVAVDDGLRDARFAVRESVQERGVGAVLCVPLAGPDAQLVGALYLEGPAGRFGARERALTETLAGLLGTPLANARRHRELSHALARADRLAVDRARRAPAVRLLGESPPVRALLELVAKVAPGSHPVLITGESGSGKELVARAIHAHSQVAGGVFLAENVSALSEHLAEAELFGHERGAFTGAHTDRPGLFRLAQDGTLLLDEVGELSLELQAKLLRVLQEREVRPVGGRAPLRVNARVLAATHRDLAALVRAGRFREDLYYRLSVVTVHVPPLRERLADLPRLLEHFLAEAAAEQGREPPPLDPPLLERLLAYPWPGNVRELQAYATRLVLAGPQAAELGDGRPTASAAGLRVSLEQRDGAELLDLREARVVFDKAYLRLALERCGSVSAAARALGLNRSYLSELVKRYDLKG